MFDRWLKLPAHKYLHLTALLILAVGISINNVLMSIGTIWIISNAIIQADFKAYWERIKKNKFLWVLIFFILWHFASLLWSDDIAYGFKDIRMKLPLFVIPLVMGIQKPLSHTFFKWILMFFILTVCLASVINYVNYTPDKDIREMSLFLSHVRFAISITLALGACLYLSVERSFPWFIFIPIMVWLMFYTYKSQVLTGYILFAILAVLAVYYLFKRLNARVLKFAFSITLVLGITITSVMVYLRTQAYLNQEKVNFSELELYSPSGNPYYHDTTSTLTENGNLVWIYVQHDEMRQEWNKVSTLDYDGTDKKEQPLYGTIMRYLTSMGERKDSTGITKLLPQDVINIENGSTSMNAQNGFMARLDVLLLELFRYRADADPNGSTMLQRKEHLRTATHLLGKHWAFGVGIGDITQKFEEAYNELESRLSPENRWRSHNQYLTTWIGMGIFGFLAFTFLIFYPLFTPNRFDFFFCFTSVILITSALFQDIIETQAGITIFSLFLSLSLFASKPKHGRKLKLV